MTPHTQKSFCVMVMTLFSNGSAHSFTEQAANSISSFLFINYIKQFPETQGKKMNADLVDFDFLLG